MVAKNSKVSIRGCILIFSLTVLIVGVRVFKNGVEIGAPAPAADLQNEDPFHSVRFPSYRNLSALYHELPDMFSTLPKSFLPQYRSFCWMHPIMDLVCLPAVYLAGIMKCGSSELFKNLIRHPNMVSPASKEEHYWTRYRFEGRKDDINPETFEQYLTWLNANEIGADDLLMDGTQTLSYEQAGWEQRYPWAGHPPYYNPDIIHNITPGAKIIFILRNPVERLYSEYYYVARNRPDRTKYTFDVRAREAVDEFNGCLKNDTLHNCCYKTDLKYRNDVQVFVGIYMCYIIGWKEQFRENMLVVQLEEYSNSPGRVLKRVWEFLEVQIPSPDEYAKLERYLASAKRRNARNEYDSEKGDMLKSTYNFLNEFYRPYNLLLAEYLKDKKFAYNVEK